MPFLSLSYARGDDDVRRFTGSELRNSTQTNTHTVSDAVDCFKCSSRNGSNPACEDPFHNLNTTRITSPLVPESPPNVIYHTPCYAGKKGRNGLFPASACIKLVGTFGE